MRAVLIDDDTISLSGLKEILSVEGFECLDYSSADAFLFALKTFPSKFSSPCVVISDVKMPGLGGIGLVRALRSVVNAPVILVSGQSDTEDVIAGFRGGIFNFVLKPYDPVELIILAKQAFRFACAEWAKANDHNSQRQNFKSLTKREQDVARCIQSGMTAREISQSLDITERTVKMHKRNIKDKLGTTRTAALIRTLDSMMGSSSVSSKSVSESE